MCGGELDQIPWEYLAEVEAGIGKASPVENFGVIS
jgi:hypothetical protein